MISCNRVYLDYASSLTSLPRITRKRRGTAGAGRRAGSRCQIRVARLGDKSRKIFSDPTTRFVLSYTCRARCIRSQTGAMESVKIEVLNGAQSRYLPLPIRVYAKRHRSRDEFAWLHLKWERIANRCSTQFPYRVNYRATILVRRFG